MSLKHNKVKHEEIRDAYIIVNVCYLLLKSIIFSQLKKNKKIPRMYMTQIYSID